MATRLNYAVPIARQLLIDTSRGLRPGGLSATTGVPSEGKPLIIVTGAGRSGTSAVGRVLHESGIGMGSDLGPPTDANPEGYYEDMGVWWLHERLFKELGMSDTWRPGRWPWRSTVLAVAAGYREEMKDLVSKAAGGWKDPHFAITLEAWLPLLPAPPKLVVCLRSPRAYSDSTIRLFGFVDRETAERLWANHNRRILDVIRDYKLEATCVEYDALVERPEEATAALAEFVGHPLKPEYVNPQLRRFRHPVPEKYARLYRKVQALAPNGSPLVTTLEDGTVTTSGDGGALRSRPSEQERAAKPHEAIQIIDAYIEQVNAIYVQTRASKAVWTVEVGLPRPKLAQFERLGPTLSEAMAQTRAASAAYASVLNDAQETLVTLDPPPGFERYHELSQRELNLERMLAELMLAAAQGEAPNLKALKGVIRAWRRFGRSSVFEKAQERRQREYTQALEASGYLAARRAASPT